MKMIKNIIAYFFLVLDMGAGGPSSNSSDDIMHNEFDTASSHKRTRN